MDHKEHTALIVSEKITAEKALDQVLEQTAEILHRYLMSLQQSNEAENVKYLLKIKISGRLPAAGVLVAHDLTPS